MTIKTRIVIGISFVVVLLTGYFIYVESYSRGVVRELKTLQVSEVALLDAAWQIRWLDEALTASAARYVQSKADPVWQKRYDQHVAMLDAAIATASSTANPADLRHFTEVDDSNKKLVELETKIFALAGATKYAEAETILSGEYAVQKAIYKKGLDDFFASQKTRLDDTMAERVHQANTNRLVATGVLAGIAACIALLGVLLLRTVVTRITRLTAVSNRLAKGEIDGLTIDMGGNDEISRLADGMQGVAVALEMLMSEAATRAASPELSSGRSAIASEAVG